MMLGHLAKERADRVCHEEQMTVWTGEVAGRLSMGGYFRDDLSYDDVLSIHDDLAQEIRRIVESAFGHPELGAQMIPRSAGARRTWLRCLIRSNR